MNTIEDFIVQAKDKFNEKEIRKEYDKFLVDTRANCDGDEAAIIARALKRTMLYFKKQLRSPAVMFQGIILAAGQARDLISKQRDQAIASYKADPDAAIRNGVVSVEGEVITPLDSRPTWANGKANPSFGKPLPEHSWLRTVYGVGAVDGETPRFFIMNLNGERGKDMEIPLHTPVEFKAVNKTEATDTHMKMNASAYTTFEPWADSTMPGVMDVINTFCKDNVVDINNLEDWHKSNETNFNRFCIVKGDILTLNPEPTSFGSYVMSLDSDDWESEPTMCWVDGAVNIDNLAEADEVVVFGSTSKGIDSDGNPRDVSINVMGIHSLTSSAPTTKKEISPTDLSTEAQ